MANQANITVFDGAATPVSHLLVALDNKTLPDGTRVALYAERLLSLPSEAQVRAEIRQRTLASGVVETRTDVYVPVMESVSGQNASGYTAAPKVAFVDKHSEVSYAHPRSTASTRNLATQILRNLMNNVSTSVTPVVAGPVYEAHALQVMPS